MKKIVAILIIPFLVAGFTSLSSCKNRSEAKQKKEQEQDQVASLEKELEKNIYEIPSSANIMATSRFSLNQAKGRLLLFICRPRTKRPRRLSAKTGQNPGTVRAEFW